ncbi:hypothetical protein DB31_1095 [Hyalangium minutum]|uniref:Uncharacterized protein n=1 Tax=Hyalangium minutum TaxID=394096 RepID=A0A085WEB7_9BACT|nr:hypothetical protein DB31_1095 [Hyalangium minutum]
MRHLQTEDGHAPEPHQGSRPAPGEPARLLSIQASRRVTR